MPIEVEVDGKKQTVYTVDEHKQILQDSVGDLAGLKANNASLKAEKQEALEKLGAIEEEKKAAELESAKAAGDMQKVQELLAEEKAKSDKALSELQSTIHKKETDDLFNSVISEKGLGGVKNKHLEKILRSDFEAEFEDGVMKIKNKADGTYIDKSEFVNKVSEMDDYADFISGGNANGAGVPAAKDTAGAGKQISRDKFNELNPTEQKKYALEVRTFSDE